MAPHNFLPPLSAANTITFIKIDLSQTYLDDIVFSDVAKRTSGRSKDQQQHKRLAVRDKFMSVTH